MPLLALFSRKGKSSSKVSTTTLTASNISLNEDEYVSVSAPSPSTYYSPQLPASSSKLALPFRRKNDKSFSEQNHGVPCTDPLLEPPPRRSSLFQNYQDDRNAYLSTQSLPDSAERRTLRPQPQPHQISSQASTPTKKSLFNWTSHKDRGKSSQLAKSTPPEGDDASFNLKSFRHVRPDSPSLVSSRGGLLPSSTLPPIPTSNVPSPPVSFQVTSRRPRGNSTSELLSSPPSSPVTASQQKIPAGVFRQGARRSTASLTLSDSPVLSPTRSSLDDRPPPSLLLPQTVSGTPPRPPRQSPPRPSVYTPKSVVSTSSTPLPSPPAQSNLTPSSAPKPLSPPKVPRLRTNAFEDTSSSSSSEEDEDTESESDAEAGAPRISRRRTIKQGQGQVRGVAQPSANTTDRPTPRAPLSSLPTSKVPDQSATRNDRLRTQSSLGVYDTGSRPRASLSVGALDLNAKEARASIGLAANARLANTFLEQTTPKPTFRPLSQDANAGSDTSESEAHSAPDSEEDAPLSSLLIPARPGTSMSTRSAPSPRKPLVDLNAPSTLTGRPVKAPPPLAREENERQHKPKMSVDTTARSRGSQMLLSNSRNSQTLLTGNRSSQVPLSQNNQNPRQSQSSLSTNPRSSFIQSPHSAAGSDTVTTPSFSDGSGRYKTSGPNTGGRQSTSTTNLPSSSPVAPPSRPFARRESPASSTGDSSSGKAPLTPRDGSDTRSVYSGPSAMSKTGRATPHGRKASVTFEDEHEVKGKKSKEALNSDEAKRKERRRSEARAAIELGNVVNGPPPVDDDDDITQQGLGIQGAWSQPGMHMPMSMSMSMPLPPMQPMFNMGMPPPGAYGMNFPPPMPNADPAFLAAHQQAMAIAKQTFQYAVAQQALAAANDEWERNSSMTGYGGPVGAQWGYGANMRQSAMFPQAPRSMYAGSVGGGGGGWGGTGSVYGQSFGPTAAGGRSSVYSQTNLSSAVQRPVRPRTKTAPSAASPPSNTPVGRSVAPPSSFRGGR